jgi:hypothetical protein
MVGWMRFSVPLLSETLIRSCHQGVGSPCTKSYFNCVDRFTALRFTATDALLAARRIRILSMPDGR